MASKGLGTLTLDLIAKIGGFVGPLSQAERELERKARSMETRSKALGKTMGDAFTGAAGRMAGFVAGFVSVNAVFAGFKGALLAADNLDELSARLGISTEKLSTLGYAAQMSGSSLEDLAGAFPKLAKNIAEAADSGSKSAELFKVLGINVRDAAGNLRSADEMLPQIADRFASLNNQTTETALAMELFGKSGSGLLEFLNRGSEGMGDLEDKARSLGLEIDGGTAAAAATLKDEMDGLKAATQGALTRALEPMIPVLREITGDMTQFATDTDKAREAGEDAAEGVLTLYRSLQTLLSAGDSIRGFLVDLQNGLVAVGKAQGWANPANWIRSGIDSLRKANDPFYNVQSGTSAKAGMFTNVQSGMSDSRTTGVQTRLNGFFAGGGSKSKNGKSGGKSDAQREAEALKREVDSLNESLDRQRGLLGATTEEARVRYEVEIGGLKLASQPLKDQLILKARALDLEKADREEMEKRAEADKAQHDRVQDFLKDTEFENSLLGKTIEDKEVLNALRYAGVDALSAEGEAIRESTLAMMEHEKQLTSQIELMDEFRSGFGNAIVDFVTGAKSMKEALADFANDFARRITQLIAERWIEKLFGQMGSSAGGSSGEGWGSLLGSLFGGKRAGGGHVGSGMLYQVNERGPEMLSVGGRDFLMMGASGGRVTPNHRLGGGGTINQTFVVQGAPDRRTREQLASTAGREARRAMARTG